MTAPISGDERGPTLLPLNSSQTRLSLFFPLSLFPSFLCPSPAISSELQTPALRQDPHLPQSQDQSEVMRYLPRAQNLSKCPKNPNLKPDEVQPRPTPSMSLPLARHPHAQPSSHKLFSSFWPILKYYFFLPLSLPELHPSLGILDLPRSLPHDCQVLHCLAFSDLLEHLAPDRTASSRLSQRCVCLAGFRGLL